MTTASNEVGAPQVRFEFCGVIYTLEPAIRPMLDAPLWGDDDVFYTTNPLVLRQYYRR